MNTQWSELSARLIKLVAFHFLLLQNPAAPKTSRQAPVHSTSRKRQAGCWLFWYSDAAKSPPVQLCLPYMLLILSLFKSDNHFRLVGVVKYYNIANYEFRFYLFIYFTFVFITDCHVTQRVVSMQWSWSFNMQCALYASCELWYVRLVTFGGWENTTMFLGWVRANEEGSQKMYIVEILAMHSLLSTVSSWKPPWDFYLRPHWVIQNN